ncbi:MAG: acyl-CoA thioesterase [candidate division KSB1 bacterium]|nr:acyl-CoA thioesterase [candidate division KSB1 bacterium]
MANTSCSKRVADSKVVTEIIAFPSDANTRGVVYGGRLLHWVDMVASLVARKHCEGPVATLRIEFDFLQPVQVGDHVRFVGLVTRVFHRSFEVQVDVYAGQDFGTQESLAARGFLVFSCLDEQGRPRAAPELVPESEEERARWEEAGRRRELRESLSGAGNSPRQP